MGCTVETRCKGHARHISLQHLIKSETEEQKRQNKLGENDYTGRSDWVCRPYMVRVMKEAIKAKALLANLTPVRVTEKFHAYCETRMLIAVFLRACTCPLLSQLNAVHAFSCFLKTYFSIYSHILRMPSS